MTTRVLAVLGLMLLAGLKPDAAQAAEPQVIPLWPEGAPGPKATTDGERDMTTAQDSAVAGKPVIRLGNVTSPSLTVYRPTKERDSGVGIIVFPGGGYHILALDLEGTEVCQWLNSIGITAVLLKYRVPQPKDQPRYAEPLQDAQRAMSLVRSHASEWGIKPDRIGVLGFSAGGHLAALLGTQPRDSGTRPDFCVLIYPAYLSVRDEGETLAPEINVTHDNPPVFLVQTEDDHLFVGGSLLYYRALKKAGVPAEMHLYSNGGHGYGLRATSTPVTHWPSLAEMWLAGITAK